MFKRFATGIVVGAAAAIVILPQLDRKTQRAVRRTGKKMCCMAGGAYDNVLHYIKCYEYFS